MPALALSHHHDDDRKEEEEDLQDGGPLDPDDVLRFVRSAGSNSSPEKRARLMRAALGIPRRPRNWPITYLLPESSRDRRHVGDLYWHDYYQMNKISETCLPPMRYTHCCDHQLQAAGNQRCFHKPSPMLQIFCARVHTYLADSDNPVEVYGHIAVRDAEDYRRNYLFNRSRDNPLAINSASDYLQLLSPKRGMSMQFDCLIEVDIKIKALSGNTDDKTLIDGCFDLVEGHATFDMFIRSTIEGENGAVVFYLVILRDSVEATIEMNFLEVPGDGFDIKMCGYTAIWKNLYPFIDEQCECDSSVASAGKFPRYFVAAVEMDDTLLIDFMEGNMPISFKAAIHGSEEKEYHFRNSAVVSVKVSWSAARY